MKLKWLVLVILALFGYYLVGNNFSANLGMIDDHEIAMFLSTDGRVKLSEIPSILSQTELGKYGEYPRFRPVYYSLRVVETMLWGDNATLWYGARYVMLVVFMYYLYAILSKFFPKLVSLLTVLYLMTHPFWADLLTRLGPSEVYAMVGLPMFVWGGIKLFGKKTSTCDLVQLSLGYLLCVGNKENFLVLWPLLGVLAGIRAYQKRISKAEGLIYLLLTGFTVWVAGAVYLATSKSGADIYATSISYPARIKWFFIGLPEMLKERKIWFAALVGVIFAVLELRAFFTKGLKKQLKNPVLWQWLVLLIMAAVVMSQYVLYNNSLPTNTRYDYPALLLFPLMNLLALKLVHSGIRKKLPILFTPIKLLSYLLVVVMLIILIVSNGYSRVRAQAAKNAESTRDFQTKLMQIEEKLKQDDEVPFVMISKRYIDYEPVISIARHLRAKGVVNPLVLDYQGQQVSKDDPLGENLNERMITASKMGSESEEGFSEFSPYQEYDECYAISFRESATSECELLATF